MHRLIAVGLFLFASLGNAQEVITGTYSLDRMLSTKNLTFPRILVYDQNRILIEKDDWPKELSALAEVSGQSYCCVSDSPSDGDEPPEDCKKIVYGYDVKEHFVGLMQPSSGKPLELNDIPDSEYLIVEYFAEWCPPCHPARKKLESFIESIDSAGYIALIVDFTAMQNEI
ncbi:hypothetical protein [Saccharophagus degradans]|uniref:Thioredoxin domain-containing protein n=1 Tax=Saccharophagus degradans (strain 2-40 / ATCC 43961 / DSM 17024) TaxID=203122 RepID=Q21JN5_SACD2|nr:hypothetical protein [Saccharophagus degradans]ABD81094.1 hypothetical protein Sde_1834 [Saccharophagus degradans 2-40]